MRVIKAIFKIFIILFLLGVIAVAGFVGYEYHKTPSIDPNAIYDSLEKTSYLYDDNGELIDTLYFSQDRKLAEFEEMPSVLLNSFIAIEDKTFYKHHGLNLKRIIGAIVDHFKGGGQISGTSTITQQLARNVFLTDRMTERSIDRKMEELFYSFQLENALSKDEIIEAYLNTIYFGYGCYGVDAAAHTYFSKDVEDLTLKECAVLASLPQAPDTLAPLKTYETETTTKLSSGLYADSACEERRDLVLKLMADQGYITSEEAAEASVPVADILNPSIDERDSTYTYFKDYLIQELSKDIAKEFNISEGEAEKYVYTGGLKIYSTVNTEMQKVILKEFENDYNFPSNYGKEKTQAAMVITEVGTGKIKAMVGGRNGTGEKLFNRATSPRQPGSSIKPLAVYSAALQKSYDYANKGQKFPFINYQIDKQGTSKWGDYITTNSIVVDEKCYINGEVWPYNVTRRFSGKKTFRQALQQSINTCAVKILYQVGLDYSEKMLESYGISTIKTEGEYNDINPAALALGAMTDGVTPLEMALAYATFPNNGIRNSAVVYTSVLDDEGNEILVGESEETKVLDEGVAWIMTDVLKSVVTKGIGYPAAISGVQVGGKTGTTDSAYDIWFCGFAPRYSAALWIGTDKNDTMTSQSGPAAALWGKIMNQIPEVKGGDYRDMPSDVVRKGNEYFTAGTEPAVLQSASEDKKKNGDLFESNRGAEDLFED